MMKHPWFYRVRTFYILLLIVLIGHMSFLALRISFEETPPEEGMKVRIVDDVPSKRDKKQIVQSEDPQTETKPKDAKYFSDKSRSFDLETKARKIDKFKKAAQGGAPAQRSKKDLKLSDLAAAAGQQDDPFMKAAKDYTKKKQGLKSGDPNEATVSATNDHVEDVPLGDLTHLNTQEYKYYGYYFRIRQKLEQYWGRNIQEKAETIAKSGRQVATSDEFITALQVTLNSHGKITSIKIIGPSGVKELDDAAIESFNQAGPFPNPPKDLVVNGKVTVEWGFVVKT